MLGGIGGGSSSGPAARVEATLPGLSNTARTKCTCIVDPFSIGGSSVTRKAVKAGERTQVETQCCREPDPLRARVRVCSGGCPDIRLGKHAMQIVARQIGMWVFFNKSFGPPRPRVSIRCRPMELWQAGQTWPPWRKCGSLGPGSAIAPRRMCGMYRVCGIQRALGLPVFRIIQYTNA